MKICLFNNLYGQFARGGAESAVRSLVAALAAVGHEIFIVTTLPRGLPAPSSKNINIYYLNGLSSIYYHLGRLPYFLRFFWHLGNLFNFAGYYRVKKILAKEKPDLVMSHNLMGMGFLTPLAIKKLNIRHYHFLHDIQLLHPSGLMIYGREKILNSLGAKIYQAITRVFFSLPEKIISPSNWLMREHTNRGFFKRAEKLIIANPAPAACQKTLHSGGQKFRFLYVGQIESHKGVLFLIETFAELKNIEAELIIIGDGSQSQAVKKICETDQNISFLGRKSREEVLAAMNQADCLVVPSLCYENAPTVIFEAIACGLPVIASRIGGIPELLDYQLTFQPGDKTEMLAKFNWAIEHTNELMRRTDYSRSKQMINDSATIVNCLGL